MATMPETTSRSSPAVTDRLAVRLRALAAGHRAACRAHPFVRGIEDGSLPPDTFARWVIQDWRYLQTYVEVLEKVADSAPTRGARARWRETAALTRDEELDLHRSFAARFGLDAAALDAAPTWPATAAYTDFLRTQAQTSYALGVASLVPCGVGYVSLAQDLSRGPAPADDRYAEWISTYADPAFAEAVAWMEAELDGVVGDVVDIERVYRQGAQHELAFWDQLWHGPG